MRHQLLVEKRRTRAVSKRGHELKDELEAFHRKFSFDILVLENAFAIPVNIPLGLALTEFVIENRQPHSVWTRSSGRVQTRDQPDYSIAKRGTLCHQKVSEF